MCEGGLLLADFEAGTCDVPDVPEEISLRLTSTADGKWVIWAYKLAHGVGHEFQALTGGSYPTDAVAECRRGVRHEAPDPACTCGFHALSAPWPIPRAVGLGEGLLQLEVALTGRVLAFEWGGGGVLFRAARQTVVRANGPDSVQRPTERVLKLPPPDDPDDRLAPSQRREPQGAGPVRLRLPEGPTPVVAITDDAGYCGLRPQAPRRRRPTPVLAGV
jgi:hypothetical protein